MSIRVGTVININDAYNSYQRQLKQLKRKKAETTNPKDKKACDDAIKSIELEIEEFLQLIIPDPECSKVSPYLSKGYDYLYLLDAQDSEEKELDIEG